MGKRQCLLTGIAKVKFVRVILLDKSHTPQPIAMVMASQVYIQSDDLVSQLRPDPPGMGVYNHKINRESMGAYARHNRDYPQPFELQHQKSSSDHIDHGALRLAGFCTYARPTCYDSSNGSSTHS